MQQFEEGHTGLAPIIKILWLTRIKMKTQKMKRKKTTMKKKFIFLCYQHHQ